MGTLVELGCLFFNSGNVVFNRNRVDNDWHKAVVDTAELTTLSVEGTSAVDVKAYLVKAAGAAIHFHAKRGDSSAM